MNSNVLSSSIPSRSSRVPGRSYSQSSTPQSDNQVKFSILVLALYVFVLTSRVLDVSSIWFLRIPLILLIVLTVMTMARLNLKAAFASPVTRLFGLFTVWVIVSYPFSYWRSGSTGSVILAVESFAIYLIIVQLVTNHEEWRRLAGAFAFAVMAAAFLSFKIGVSVDGRIALPGGTLGDPNEFALTLIIGVPFWWLKASRSSPALKFAYLLCTIPIFIAFSRAGSRSGMLAFAALFLVLFVTAPGSRKVVIGVVAVIGVLAGAAFLPGYIKARYMTFFSADASADLDAGHQRQLSSDIASSEGRKALLIQSITMTFQHPLLGVGPGVFSYVSWDLRKNTTGSGGQLLVSHNTYTQVSSETGIPGFLLFVSAVYLCFKYTIRNYRRLRETDPVLAQSTRYFLLSFTGLAVGIFFLSTAYTPTIAIMMATAVSLNNVVSRRVEDGTPEPGLAAQTPRWQSPASARPQDGRFRSNPPRVRDRVRALSGRRPADRRFPETNMSGS
jgi:O-antigen ligase